MPFKDLLLALTTYPQATPVAAIRRAVDLARALDARISAVACEVQVRLPGRFEFLANAMLDVPALVATEAKKSARNAQELLAAFEDDAREKGVFGERLVARSQPALIPDLFAAQARLRDMTIIPVPEGDYVDQWSAETVIFGSGRPTLVFSESEQTREPAVLDRVVVAWDASRTAARALWDALPILARAKDVRVLVVDEAKKGGADTLQTERLLAHLALHGIAARVHTENAAGRTIGEAVRAYVTAERADLLVMGAYGHSKLREFVLGGVTRTMLSHPPVPVFLSH